VQAVGHERLLDGARDGKLLFEALALALLLNQEALSRMLAACRPRASRICRSMAEKAAMRRESR